MTIVEVIKTLQPVAISFEGIAAFASILFFRKYNTSVLKWMPIVLTYTFLNDLFGAYFLGDSKYLGYNIASTITYLYFYTIFYKTLSNHRFKLFIRLGVLAYVASLILNFFLQNVLHETFYISYIVGGAVIILCTILYFIESLSHSTKLILHQKLIFWFSVGLLLFYVAYLPIKISKVDIDVSDDTLYIMSLIHIVLNIIMYSCFTLGFKWAKK